MTLPPRHRPPLDALRDRVADRVRLVLAAGDPEAVARAAHDLVDEAKARAEAGTSGPPPACAAGCAFCCHVHVEVSRPEVIAIARFLERQLSTGELAAFKARLSERAARTDALSDEARWAARVPCALLDGERRCSVHPVRPVRCRAFHSGSADACRAAFEGASDEPPDTNATVVRAVDAVEAGYDRALAEAGEPASGIRLERGLLEVLRAVS